MHGTTSFDLYSTYTNTYLQFTLHEKRGLSDLLYTDYTPC